MFSFSWLQLCLHPWDYTDGSGLQSAPGCICEWAPKVVSVELPDDFGIFDHQVPSPVCLPLSRDALQGQLGLFLGEPKRSWGIQTDLEFSKLTKMLSQANTIHFSWELLLKPQLTLNHQGCLSNKLFQNMLSHTRLLKCNVAGVCYYNRSLHHHTIVLQEIHWIHTSVFKGFFHSWK